MKLIKRSSVLFKTLILLTGFCVIMMWSADKARAQYPSASFTSNVFSGCAPLSVDFTNLSTQATDYLWDFGNGNVSSLQDPTTVYLSSGYYTVTLVAINNLTGNRDTLVATNYINVIDDPVADFSASPLSACEGNNSVAFTNLSVNATNYIWDFGDGTFSVQSNPVHIYTNAGVYTVKLIARNAYGCNKIIIKNSYITIFPNAAAAFTVNQQSSCDINTVFNFTCTTTGATGWQWNFGDGGTSNLQNPSHVYGVQGSFTVTLVVFNGNGCSDTLVSPGYINIGPNLVPTFTVNSQTGCAPFTADLVCTVPGATSWLWDFGDGSTSSVENPSHIYLNAGSYTITLTVTTSMGCNGTVVLPGYIVVDPIPVPSFTVNDPAGCNPHTTFFTNTSTNATTYLWDFGNGFTATDTDPFQTFTDTGVYTVTLTAYSPNGCEASVTQSAAVTVESITASLTGTPRTGCAPLPVTFTGSSVPTGITWNWDFGDGTTGVGQSVSHTYAAIGNYTVSLVVTSASGCIDTITRNNFIRVVDDTTAYTVPDTILICIPTGAVSFTDPTIGSNSWLWDFGDGTTGTVRNPTHTYMAPGIYTVTLTTNMAGGCSQVFNPYAIINVLPFVTSPITSLTTSNCAPFTVQLDNLTMNVASYLWNFGDGTTSTLQNPVHVYAQPGTYTISLLLTSVNGCQTSLTTTVTFGYQDVITVSDTTNCLGDTVLFGLNPLASFASATWNFGDGNSSSQLQPSHVYGATGTYSVSVTVTDITGCVYTFNYPYTIYVSDPVSSFTINQPTSGCVPYVVQFINNSTGANGYYWYFGDGTNATAANPSHTYNLPGVYTVTLNAAKKGCVRSSTIVNFITVNEATANLSFTPDSGCVPLNVAFTDLSTNAVSWLWNFGDGNTSTLQNPVHTFLSQPSGDITLSITDANGCSDTITMGNVNLFAPDIQASDTLACNPSAISFSTSINAVSYLWDFGDGTTSNLQNPVHIYSQSGTFSVSLNCVMASGCTATNSAPGMITITAPVSDFMSPTVAICAPSLVNFVNQSTGATSWLWDFGDGTTSVNQNPSHIYNVPGSYTVSLISYGDSGCSDTLTLIDYILVPGTLTEFTVTGFDFCENSLVQFTDQSINASNWFWNFGDGFTSAAQSPSHVYSTTGSYTVTLITTDSVGCSSFYSLPNPVLIHPNPSAQAVVMPSAGCMPLTSTFTNSSTGADTYTWHFGNGATASAPDTTYTYTVPGIYNPYLVVATTFGCTDTFFAAPVGVSGLPVPDFSNSGPACTPATVTFMNNSSALLNPTYSWNFGNGQTGTQQNPVVVYNSSGVYQVSLVVTNMGGCSDSIVKPITILDSPAAMAGVSATSGCAPLTVDFSNTSVNATSYLWNFGDGTTSSDTTPSHTYTAGGNYQVMLIAANSNGCADTLLFPGLIQVNQTPVANFTRTPASGCSPLNVVFTSTSTQLSSPVYSWNFGNGQTGNLTTHAVTYTSDGLYPASLIVTNSTGCSDTVTKNITVNQSPVAIAAASGYSGCTPYAVNFTNSSINATGYSWNFGDGTTSTQLDPVHTYSTAGIYTVTLIVNGTGGCADTLTFPGTIHVKATPSASFVPSSVTGCTPLAVDFNNTSTNLVGPAFSWNFGNGNQSIAQDPSFTYLQGGSNPVTLIVTNSEGCSDTASANITANLSPVAQALSIDTTGCAPYPVTFTSTSLYATDIQWNFGDGTTSDSTTIQHIFNTPGIYQPYLIAISSEGCTDTLLFSTPVYVNPNPVAAFTVNQTSNCSGTVFQFINQSTPVTGLSYLWSVAGNNYTTASPAVSIIAPGFYDAGLIVTNQYGCSDTMIQTNYLQVFDTLPPSVSPILSVSVLTNSAVQIIWQNNAALDLGAYILYRFNQATNTFVEIYRDTTPNNSSMNVSSTYIDGGLNTLNNVYTYKLHTIDQCAYGLPLSALTAHTTINVTASPVNNNIRVNWTGYMGCQVAAYEVNRVDLATGTASLIATVPANTLTYLDQGFPCPESYSYRIKATSLCGTSYYSLSDTSNAKPVNILENQKVAVVRSTVIDDHDVLTEWLPPVLAPERVMAYKIFRSVDNLNFTEIASLPATSFSFIDYSTDVHQQEYYYRVEVINDCNISGAASNHSSSVLLKSNWEDEKTKLWWTPYTDWDTGVDYYIIERANFSGQWIPVKTVDGNEVNTILDE